MPSRENVHAIVTNLTRPRCLDSARHERNWPKSVQPERSEQLQLKARATNGSRLINPRRFPSTAAFISAYASGHVFEPPIHVPSFTVQQAWLARYHADPAHRWFRGLVKASSHLTS